MLDAYDTTSYAAGVGGGIVFGGKTGSSGATSDLGIISGIKENGTNGNIAGALTFHTRADGGSFTEKLRIASDGNVGIGTTNPSAFKLEIAGSIGPTADDTYDLGSNTKRWRDLYLGPESLHIGTSTADEYDISYDTTNNFLGFNVNGSGNPDIIFSSSGRLGIGTTGPGTFLEVQGVSQLRLRYDSNESADINVGSTGTLQLQTPSGSGNNIKLFSGITSGAGATPAFLLQSMYDLGSSDEIFQITDNSTDLFTILGSGNVGIGTTDPTALSHIQQTGASDAFRVDDAASDLTPFVIDQNGNVGIGKTGPVTKLNVSNTTEQLRLEYDPTNYSSFTLNSSGDLTIAPSGGDLNITGNADISSHLAVGSNSTVNSLYTAHINENYTSSGDGSDTFSLYLSQTRTEGSAVSTTTQANGIYNNILYRITEGAGSGYGYGLTNRVYADNAYTYRGLYGTRNTVFTNSTASSGQDSIYGDFNDVYLNSSGTLSEAYGSRNHLYINTSATGTITSAYGQYNEVNASDGAGSTIGTAIGSYSTVYSGSAGTITSAYGVWGEVFENSAAITAGYGGRFSSRDAATNYGVYGVSSPNDAETFTNTYAGYFTVMPNGASTILTNAYGVFGKSYIDTGTTTNAYGGYFQTPDAATTKYGVYSDVSDTATNNYGFYGTISGGTTDWGIFLTGEDKNYFSGNVGVGTSTPTALTHIIQTGAANAFQVDDQSSDTTPFVIDQQGYVGIGATSPKSFFNLVNNITDDNYGKTFVMERYRASQYGNAITSEFSRNGTIGSHTVVNSGDFLLTIAARGSDGTDFKNAGRIDFNADGTAGTGDMPGRISFWTTPDGSSTIAQRMQINNAGVLQVNDLASDTLQHYICSDTSGNLTDSNTACNTSSIRYKEDVRTIENALDIVDKLDGVRFKWKPEYGGYEDIGFIAEEVGKIFPSLVSYEANGIDAKSLQYDRLTSVNTQAIKELNSNFKNYKNSQNNINLNDYGNISVEFLGGTYTAKNNQTQSIYTQAAAFAEIVSAKVKAGMVQAQEASFDSISIAGKTIREVVLEILSEMNLTSNQTTAPQVQTDVISSLSSGSVSLELGSLESTPSAQNQLPKFTIVDKFGDIKASIDVLGNATFSGNLKANTADFNQINTAKVNTDDLAVSGSATISGLLESDEIKTKTIFADKIITKFGDINEILTASISGKPQISAPENPQPEINKLNLSQATVSGELFAKQLVTDQGNVDDRLTKLEALIGQIATPSAVDTSLDSPASTPTPTPVPTETGTQFDVITDPTMDATSSALLTFMNIDNQTIPDYSQDQGLVQKLEGSLIINNNLTVFGLASLGPTSIAGSLLVDGTISIDSDGINTLADTFYIQKDGLADINIMNGLLEITSTGNININGNMSIFGNLAINTISPSLDDVSINLESSLSSQIADVSAGRLGKLLIKGQNNQPVIAMDASGSANFSGDIAASGSGTFNKLVIAGSNDNSAQPAQDQIASNATVGKEILPADNTQITITNTQITQNSYIYITPITSTNNQVLYVKSQTPATADSPGSFTVSIDQPLDRDIQFNWWIIN